MFLHEYVTRIFQASRYFGLIDNHEFDVHNRVIRTMIEPWSFLLQGKPIATSIVSPDASPIEFQLSISSSGTKIRLLFELISVEPQDRKQLAYQSIKTLSHQWKLNTDLILACWGNIAPKNTCAEGYLMIHYTISCGKPIFRVYIPTYAFGKDERNEANLIEILNKLGFDISNNQLKDINHLNNEKNRIIGLGLPISADSEIRSCNLYCRHYDAKKSEIHNIVDKADDKTKYYIDSVIDAIYGDRFYLKQPYTSSITLSKKSPDTIPSSTIHFPLWVDYPDDEVVECTIKNLLTDFQLPTDDYTQFLKILAQRDLKSGKGIHSYLSFRYLEQPQFNIYLSPELYRSDPGRLYLD